MEQMNAYSPRVLLAGWSLLTAATLLAGAGQCPLHAVCLAATAQLWTSRRPRAAVWLQGTARRPAEQRHCQHCLSLGQEAAGDVAHTVLSCLPD